MGKYSDERPSIDYGIALTSGFVGFDLDEDSIEEIAEMNIDELENIMDQFASWYHIFKQILNNKKSQN